MRCAAAFALLLASVSTAAPVPKELKANGSTAGTWKLVRPDGENPGQFIPGNQYWIIDADCGVIFGATPIQAAGAIPTEIFKMDPATNEVDHFTPGRAARNYMGVYELKGDNLTIGLDLRVQTRPKTLNDPGVTVWHLRRVKESK